MHLCPLAATLLTLAAVASAGEPTPGVQIVKAAAISEKIERAAPSPGGRGGVFAEDEGYRVHVAERDMPGQAEQHEADTDVWYVIAGGATVVTGGTLVDATATAPGETRGSAIRGGHEFTVGAGDLVTIRPGVPHWVKAVAGRIRSVAVKGHARPAAAGGAS